MIWERVTTVLLCIALAVSLLYCFGCSVGLTGTRLTLSKEGDLELNGPDYRGENTKDVTSPVMRIEKTKDGFIIYIGPSKANEFVAMLDSKWLLWAGIAILIGGGAVLYFKLYGLASIFGVTGLGIIAFAYNPWLLTLTGIGIVALVAYSIYTGKTGKTLKTKVKELSK